MAERLAHGGEGDGDERAGRHEDMAGRLSRDDLPPRVKMSDEVIDVGKSPSEEDGGIMIERSDLAPGEAGGHGAGSGYAALVHRISDPVQDGDLTAVGCPGGQSHLAMCERMFDVARDAW
jgi:hypothetical protein